MNTTAEQTVDAKLDEAHLRQFGFKGDKVRLVAAAVCRAFAAAPGRSVWFDEIELPELAKDDRNIIGLVARSLAKWGIIRRCEGSGDHRRSRRDGRKGGVCWRYEIASHRLLETFAERNGIGLPQQERQPELL